MTKLRKYARRGKYCRIPCVTVRFGSDRSETLLEGANVLAPPVNARLIADITDETYDNPNMRKESLYGENVSEKIVDGVLSLLRKEGELFRLDPQKTRCRKILRRHYIKIVAYR